MKQVPVIVKASWLLLLPAFSLLGSCQKENPQNDGQNISRQVVKSTTSNSVENRVVTFTMQIDFSTNPAFGTFVATGALNTSGTAEFDYNPNNNFITAHNVITLRAVDGTITIHDECEFAVDKAFPSGRGSYEIVGGTGAYANLGGNGAESFPSPTEDILSGPIH